MRRSNRKSQSPIIKITLLVVGILAGLYFIIPLSPLSTRTPTPVEKLSEAVSGSGQLDKETLRGNLEAAMQEKEIRPWASLLLARKLEGEGLLAESLELYSSIPEASPASLDAKVALFRLSTLPEAKSPEAGEFGRFLNQLEEDVRLARRNDLLPEIQLLRAETAERSGNISMAETLYREVWAQFVTSEIGKRARAALDRLEVQLPAKSMAQLLEEAQVYARGGSHILALEQVEQAKSVTAKKTPAYFEALMIEEDIVRKAGRRSEADHILSTISADAGHGFADQALLRLARNAWNANNQEQALEFITRFGRRFPVSALYEDALYVKGRVLEEREQLSEAKAAYLEVVERSKTPLNQVRALRQIAWIHLRQNQFIPAAEYFEKIRESSEKGIAQLQLEQKLETADVSARRTFRELSQELEHAVFWLAFSLNSLTEEDKKSIRFTVLTPEVLLEKIATQQPYGYYRFLAEGLLNQSSSRAFPQTPTTEELFAQCTTQVPQNLERRLSLLASESLLDFVRYEIDWYFSRKHLRESTNEPSATDKFRDEITRAMLYANHSLPRRSIGFTDSLLSNSLLKPETPEEVKKTCEALLFQLSYPTPYLEQYQEAAKRHNLPLSLILALSRTESHFDAAAVSPKNAQGLMQLLPNTAKEEGLTPEQSLFDPLVNIELGTKHLAGLLARYEGEETYALAAYNAGATAVERWRTRYGDIPRASWIELIGYPETKNYVKSVLQAKYLYEVRLRGMAKVAGAGQHNDE